MTKEELNKIRKYIDKTTSNKFEMDGFSVFGEDGDSILIASKDTEGTGSTAAFRSRGDSKFFVKARKDIPRLLEEIERLKYQYRRVILGKESEVNDLKFQLERHIEVEKKRREEFKQLHGVLEEFEIPKGDQRGSYSPVIRFQLLIERVSDCVTIQGENKEEAENKLLVIFNRLLKIIPLKYDELNKNLPAGHRKEDLRKLEDEYKELGISHLDKAEEGVSILSLFATITHVFCKKRLAFKLDAEQNLLEVMYLFRNDKGEWVEDTPLNRVPSFISDPKYKDKK